MLSGSSRAKGSSSTAPALGSDARRAYTGDGKGSHGHGVRIGKRSTRVKARRAANSAAARRDARERQRGQAAQQGARRDREPPGAPLVAEGRGPARNPPDRQSAGEEAGEEAVLDAVQGPREEAPIPGRRGVDIACERAAV